MDCPGLRRSSRSSFPKLPPPRNPTEGLPRFEKVVRVECPETDGTCQAVASELGRCRPAQHFDGLDAIDVEKVAAPGGKGAKREPVRRTDAAHHHQHLIASKATNVDALVAGTPRGRPGCRKACRGGANGHVEFIAQRILDVARARLLHRGGRRDRDGIGYLVHPTLDARGTDGDLIEPRHAAIGGGGLLGRCHGWGHCPHHAQRQRCFCLARHSASQIRCRHWLAQAGSGGWGGFSLVRTHLRGGRHAAPPTALQAMRRAQPAPAGQELGRWLSVPLRSDPSPTARLSRTGNWPGPNHWKWDCVHGQNHKRESLSTASGDFPMRPSRPSRQPALVFNRQPNRRGNMHLPAPMPAEAGHGRRVSPSCRHRAAGMPQRGPARFGQESDTAPEKPWRSRLWAASASSNAGVASASVAEPVRAIAISSSSRNRRSTWATPAAPPLARPYSAGRPISTALAPSAMALSTSVPRRMPPSTSSARGPVALWATAWAARGSSLAVPGVVSRVRAPWFETTQA